MLNKTWIIGATLIMASIGIIGILDHKRVELVKALEKETAALIIQEQRAQALETRLLEVFKESQKFEKTALDINNKYTKSQRDLDALRGREQTIVSRPTLVALRINKAYEKRQKELACLTGDFNLCIDK